MLDKPAGLVVHPAPGNPDGTLVNALIAHCGDSLTGIGGERRPGIVHRLDKDTSGVMVVAKTELAHTRLSAAFAAATSTANIRRSAGACPTPPKARSRAISAAIRATANAWPWSPATASTALTNYRIIRNFGTAAALIACRLGTGRTHQIRVHLAHIGHPLIGDPVYLRRRPAVAKTLPPPAQGLALDFPRQALHAEMLGFSHPITGAKLSFSAPPPADFLALRSRPPHMRVKQDCHCPNFIDPARPLPIHCRQRVVSLRFSSNRFVTAF